MAIYPQQFNLNSFSLQMKKFSGSLCLVRTALLINFYTSVGIWVTLFWKLKSWYFSWPWPILVACIARTQLYSLSYHGIFQYFFKFLGPVCTSGSKACSITSAIVAARSLKNQVLGSSARQSKLTQVYLLLTQYPIWKELRFLKISCIYATWIKTCPICNFPRKCFSLSEYSTSIIVIYKICLCIFSSKGAFSNYLSQCFFILYGSVSGTMKAQLFVLHSIHCILTPRVWQAWWKCTLDLVLGSLLEASVTKPEIWHSGW